MIRSFLSFWLSFLRTTTQVRLENLFLSHDRRRIIHFNVTDHPTAEWASQQLRNAFCDIEPLKFLIRDRDKKFGELFTDTVKTLGIRPILTAYRSPWQWILRKTYREHPKGRGESCGERTG